MNRYKAFLEERNKINALRKLRPLKRLGHGKVIPLSAKDDLECIDFSSNDYLALSEHKDVLAGSAKLLAELGTGAGAARLMSGNLEVHQLLEKEIAQLKGKKESLIFGSGYLANTGVIPALVGRGDVIFCDRLNHASIYDGCRLSGARTIRFRHNDLNHLEELLHQKRGQFQQAMIVVESIYSMDGDRCPLKELVVLKNHFQCLLMVDEAHATGVFGPNGGGIIEEDELWCIRCRFKGTHSIPHQQRPNLYLFHSPASGCDRSVTGGSSYHQIQTRTSQKTAQQSRFFQKKPLRTRHRSKPGSITDRADYGR